MLYGFSLSATTRACRQARRSAAPAPPSVQHLGRAAMAAPRRAAAAAPAPRPSPSAAGRTAAQRSLPSPGLSAITSTASALECVCGPRALPRRQEALPTSSARWPWRITTRYCRFRPPPPSSPSSGGCGCILATSSWTRSCSSWSLMLWLPGAGGASANAASLQRRTGQCAVEARKGRAALASGAKDNT